MRHFCAYCSREKRDGEDCNCTEQTNAAEHARVEQLPGRSGFALTIETAEVGADNVRRIRGYANTFGVMRSGRIIHPQALEEWLATHGEVQLPMLAQHGYVPGFATIGTITTLKVQRSKGLYFEATIGAGTNLTDEAWTLLGQKLLSSLSIGWWGKQARWVRADDVDLDPWLAKKLKEAGATEAYAFLAIDLLEISLVDVADDADARLAARLLGPEIVEPLAAAVTRMMLMERGQTSAETPPDRAAVEAALNATGKLIEGFSNGLENRLVEIIEAKLEDLAAAYRFDGLGDADGAEQGEPADGGPEAPAAAAPSIYDLAKQVRARLK